MPVIYFVLLLICFVLLARITDLFFITSLDKISKDLKLSSDVTGATLMAVGSSAPELFVALFAVFKPGEHEAIGIGSIVGSAIFNLLVIVGATALVRNTKLTWQPVVRDLIFYAIAVSLLILFLRDGTFTLIESVTLIIIYILYVIAAFYWRKILPYQDISYRENEEKDCGKKGITWIFDRFLCRLFPGNKYYYLAFLQSITIIALLSWILVELAVLTAAYLKIPEAVVALTVLAIGTSVPDLFSSLIVARQGRGDMAVSNAIGSNIFDILIGLGLPFTIYMFIHSSSVSANEGNLINSIIILLVSVLLLFLLLIFSKWKIGKISGTFLLLLYIIYISREIIILYI